MCHVQTQAAVTCLKESGLYQLVGVASCSLRCGLLQLAKCMCAMLKNAGANLKRSTSNSCEHKSEPWLAGLTVFAHSARDVALLFASCNVGAWLNAVKAENEATDPAAPTPAIVRWCTVSSLQ